MKPRAVYVTDPGPFEEVYPAEVRESIERLVEVVASPQTPASLLADPSPLADARIILGSWSLPTLDEAFLCHAPHLEAVFYGAGSIRGFATDAMWDRGIRVFTGKGAIAEAVADYTVAAVVWSLKQCWARSASMRAGTPPLERSLPPGLYGSTVGLVGLSMVGRAVALRLRALKVKVLAHHYHCPPELERELGITFVGLDELFRTSDVVSLHHPLLDSTRGAITGELLELMKPRATFINTARGAVVREDEMIEVLRRRPDLQAVLDVTDPEPPAPDSPLRTLPNVVLTPHIAGLIGPERWMLGEAMLEELRRYLTGEETLTEVTREAALRLA